MRLIDRCRWSFLLVVAVGVVAGGSLENIVRIAAGDIDMGFAISTSVRLEYDGATLERVNNIARQIDLATLSDAPIPLHPAAQSWLEQR